MNFLVLSAERSLSPAEARRILEQRAAFTADLRRRGVLLDSERLRPTTEARRVTSTTITPGPFSDGLQTFWALRADNLEAALAIVSALPTSPGERLEVRPVMKGEFAPAKTDTPGKLFGFGVLGAASHEDGWVQVMNRIDDATHDGFGEAFVAGVRLEAPRTGRTLLNQHGRNVVTDGPFLESKEIIGGLFFMRFAGLDDAVAWAQSTAFARLGVAEVREVWRS